MGDKDLDLEKIINERDQLEKLLENALQKIYSKKERCLEWPDELDLTLLRVEYSLLFYNVLRENLGKFEKEYKLARKRASELHGDISQYPSKISENK